jgi:uncharacterized protein (TIGR02265 family)
MACGSWSHPEEERMSGRVGPAPSTPPPARAPARSQVKGTLLLARLRFLRGQGDAVAERVLRRMAHADQEALRGTILPSGWYPASLLLRLEMTAVALLAKGDRARLFREMGRFSATTNLGPVGLQRAFLREDDPHFLLRNVPTLYHAQHAGAGRREYERAGDREAVIRTFEAPDADAEDCLTAIGWLQRAIEMSGGREVRVVETACAARGQGRCEYRCAWA